MTHNEPAEPEYPQTRFRLPPGATQILLVRHGASAAVRPSAPFPLLDGQGDPDLAPAGREQAERVCARLATLTLDAVYVTTLRRTAQTAAPLLDRLGIAPVVERDLREVHLGDWEGGLFRKHMTEGHPLARRLREEERWDVIPGAENDEAFAARVRAALDRIAGAHPDGRIAVFTHAGVIGQALASASGGRPLAFAGAENGSISEIVVTGDRWLPRRFNDTSHLD